MSTNFHHWLEVVRNLESFFVEHAYQPHLVYIAVLIFFILSSFGMPIPEEVILVSSGLVAHVAMNPELYPPPPGAGPPVNVYVLATVCFVSVLWADYFIFFLGQRYGRGIIYDRRFRRFFRPAVVRRVRRFLKKYGAYAAGIFRFTPGLRFPGHLMCGAMGLKTSQFLAVDFAVALISVPTQVLLVAFYGDTILQYLKHVKFVMIFLVVGIAGFFLIRWWYRRTFLVA